MNQLEAAYLAGIVDGEGNVAISKRPPKKSCGEVTPTFLDYIKISNVDKRLLEWTQKVVGAGTIYKEKRLREKNRQLYTWHISGQSCADFLSEIYPFLVIKKDQADCIFKMRETYLSKAHLGRPLPKNIFDLRQSLCEQIAEMHHREFL